MTQKENKNFRWYTEYLDYCAGLRIVRKMDKSVFIVFDFENILRKTLLKN